MRHLIRSVARRGGFTLIELLTVMTIIAILAALILSIAGFAQKKAAMSRAQAEIQALSAGCESYKADNGTYPYQPTATTTGSIPAITGSFNGTTSGSTNVPSDILFPAGAQVGACSAGNSASTNAYYTNASLELYEALTGDLTCSGTGSASGTKNYIADMKPDVWGRSNMSTAVGSGNKVLYLSDPFGNVYGYSTACASASTIGKTGTFGYNPTFDLWSTGGSISPPYTATSGAQASGQPGDPMLQWAKNW
jgi:prepilin-type N-terminal cleavage/methylation domain-containing protein